MISDYENLSSLGCASPNFGCGALKYTPLAAGVLGILAMLLMLAVAEVGFTCTL